MLPIVNVILPVFAIMAAGYLMGRLQILGEGSSQALNGFVFYVSLPALFFISMARVPVEDTLNLPFIAAFGGGILAVFGLSMIVATLVFPNRLGGLTLHGMSAIFANTGYMGIPLLALAYGEPGRLPGIISTIINGALVMGLVTVILEIDANEGGSPLAILKKVIAGVFKSPLIVAAIAGLTFSALKIPLPAAFHTFCDLLGATAGPCALFAIGLFLVGKQVTANFPEVLWVSLLKLIAQPLVTWWLAYHVVELSAVEAASAVVLAALPTGALTFVLAQRYEVYLQRSVAIILVSTLLSVGTLSALFLYLDEGL